MHNTVQQPAAVESLGRWFAHARMESRLEQQDVARKLRLNAKVIQAIEADEFQQLGPPVFVRGYLSRYAELLGLPEQRVLERYKQLGVDEPPPLRVAPGMKSQTGIRNIRWLSYPLILALIGWLGWLGVGQVVNYFDRSAVDVASAPDGDTAIALPPRQTPGPGQDDSVAAETEAAAPATSPAEAPVATAPTAEKSPEAAPDADEAAPEADDSIAEVASTAPLDPADATPDDATTAPPADSAAAENATADVDESPAVPQLVLVFSQDCWVEIKDADGERLLYGTKKAGSRHTVSGSAPFALAFGNAPAVTLTLNGNIIDREVYVPERGTVSRFVLEAPSGD
jgi:cytoskeleton protein RodZ